MRRRLTGMQRRGQQLMAQRQHHLDHPRHPRRRLRMPDIRLHRPQPQRPPRRPALPVRRQQRLRLNRIPQLRPRPVRLHHIHLSRGHPRVRQRLHDHPLLRRPVRRRQPVTGPVLVHRAARHHRQHPVPPRPRHRQPLHHQHPDPLRQPRPVRRRRKRLTPPIRASARCRENSTNTAGVDITVTPPASARSHSPARSAWHARCNATSEDEHAVSTLTAGPSRPRRVRHPPRHHAAGVAGSRMPPEVLSIAQQRRRSPASLIPANTPVGVPRRAAGSIPASSIASQHASSSSRCCGSIASASRGLIPKNAGSKSAGTRQEPAVAGIGRPGMIRVRIKQRPDIPAPVRREPADRIAARRPAAPTTPRGCPPRRGTGSSSR